MQREVRKLNRQEIVRDMRDCLGIKGFITKNQLAKYLQKDRHEKKEVENNISAYLDGLQYIPDGRGNKYFALDVASRILEMSVKQ